MCYRDDFLKNAQTGARRNCMQSNHEKHAEMIYAYVNILRNEQPLVVHLCRGIDCQEM